MAKIKRPDNDGMVAGAGDPMTTHRIEALYFICIQGVKEWSSFHPTPQK